MKRLFTALIFILTSGLNSVQAGVVVGGTRIIYPANQSEVQIALKNKDNDKRYLVQSWVSNIDDSKAPFIMTPPIYKLDENRQTLLHVVYTEINRRCLRIVSHYLWRTSNLLQRSQRNCMTRTRYNLPLKLN